VRKPLVAGNWKMNKTCAQAAALAEELVKGYRGEGAEVAVCPPFTALKCVKEALEGSSIRLGAQNVYHEDDGAFTGEVSVPMLKDLGVELVIVGHSERRQIFGEGDALVNKKVTKVLKSGLTPILCVGETLEERETGKTEEVVRRQTIEGLKGLSEREIGRTVIAYEPIWAIGTGRSATADDANGIIGYIREILEKIAGKETADTIRILYGGSVKPANAASLLGQPHIDGALVGGASLKADEFLGIISTIPERR
jgi:triosephosphate isomerase